MTLKYSNFFKACVFLFTFFWLFFLLLGKAQRSGYNAVFFFRDSFFWGI
jgi:hypothetical protein